MPLREHHQSEVHYEVARNQCLHQELLSPTSTDQDQVRGDTRHPQASLAQEMEMTVFAAWMFET